MTTIKFHVTSAGLDMIYETESEMTTLEQTLIGRAFEETIGNACNTARDASGSVLSKVEKVMKANETFERIVSGKYTFGSGGGKADPFRAAVRDLAVNWTAKFRGITRKSAGEIVAKHGALVTYAAVVLEIRDTLPIIEALEMAKAMAVEERQKLCVRLLKSAKLIAQLQEGEQIELSDNEAE